jgi:hypothetical protein
MRRQKLSGLSAYAIILLLMSVAPISGVQAAGQRRATDIKEVHFIYAPRWGEQPQEDVSLTFRPDGRAEAILFDYEDLSVVWKRLGKTKPADGYVKSRVIERERLASLLREGKLRFIKLQTLPPALRLAVRNAINRPSEFLPVSHARLEELRRYTSFGEVYITDEDAGFTLSLYTSGP